MSYSIRRLMAVGALLLPGFILTAAGGLYLPYTEGHMDIGGRIVGGELVGFWSNDFATVNGVTDNTPTFAADEIRAVGIFDDDTPACNATSWRTVGFFGCCRRGTDLHTAFGWHTPDATLSRGVVMSGTDVFRFQIIPEPTTGVLMLFAAGGLVLARRLRPLSVVHPAKGKRPPA